MPSVMNLILGSSPTFLSYRTWYPTSPPRGTLSSCATLVAVDVTATRRGCVTATAPGCAAHIGSPYPDSYKNWGTCVVLPHPVSPQMTVTGLWFMWSTMSCSEPRIGRPSRAACMRWVRLTSTGCVAPTKTPGNFFAAAVLAASFAAASCAAGGIPDGGVGPVAPRRRGFTERLGLGGGLRYHGRRRGCLEGFLRRRHSCRRLPRGRHLHSHLLRHALRRALALVLGPRRAASRVRVRARRLLEPGPLLRRRAYLVGERDEGVGLGDGPRPSQLPVRVGVVAHRIRGYRPLRLRRQPRAVQERERQPCDRVGARRTSPRRPRRRSPDDNSHN
mmetsp:Transcript_13671/g.61386  ORF Transcript_13671/g.61386 Transcript_13671/m.61386 type:complete len:332 (-) Transcript_13671:160-1155(-)